MVKTTLAHIEDEQTLGILKRTVHALRQGWARLRIHSRGLDSPIEFAQTEAPLRAELFSSEQMRHHGRILAGTHALTRRRMPDRLLVRLADNERILIDTFQLIAAAVSANRRIVPAEEWLLDNFYLLEEQIRTARRHLPQGYSRELPRLDRGASSGLPRVYDIALETIAHGDGRVDPENLGSFVTAYQSVCALNLGELWAIPIMLRLALIENLRRVATRVATDRIGRNRAVHWAQRMRTIAEKDPKSLILAIADMARSEPVMESAFVAEFARRLQGRSPALALPLTWIEQVLAESGQTIEQSVQTENQQQAADQVSISNSIGSLRFLEATDWREFVETMSVVEQKLREDPGGVYGAMDDATRDRYRHVIERIAKRGVLSELEVARKAIQLAHEGTARTGIDARTAHVGYYLIDRGVPQLERAAQADAGADFAVRRLCCRSPLALYLATILLLTAVVTAGLLHTARIHGVAGWMLALVGAASLLSASQLAVALANWLATLLATPHLLPRMDLSAGIPHDQRTLAVIPTMLTSVAGLEGLLEALEIRFLANRDDHLHFGLLTDFRDACAQTMPDDAQLLQLARAGIERLNARYPRTTAGAFFLFHRPRRWNALEAVWMGHERKRGKLADLNALLRGRAQDAFSVVVGAIDALATVKYVITLDTDTQLPRDAARQFVGTMAHPLNRAHYDAAGAIVTQGYGILQPRVAASVTGANRSRYARMCGAEPGIDPYTRAVSDVYQDLFREGSFIGKGIYDVDAFEHTLNERFPENRILSHDLLEGCYARSGLLSDVALYEEDPSSYHADAARRYRWIRGDWQIARWLLPGVPGADGRRRRNPLSALSHWKIFDNLRRSLVPPALTLMLLLGWTASSSPWFWTLAVLGIIALPALLGLLVELLRKPADVLPGQHLGAVTHAGRQRCAQLGFMLACLPYEACRSLDAIVRTTWRMLVTRTRLLEWTASGEADHGTAATLLASCRSMWTGVAISSVTLIHLAAIRPAALLASAPILALWLCSPAIAWWLSRPRAQPAHRLSREQTLFLRRYARRTWAYFETFVGPEDHHLPPDNVQEQPALGAAHRTSPTNIGLALLSNLAAYDFGYVSAGHLLERTANTFGTMAALERYQGHFYNWYDTQSLQPLPPTYISTVDSGNLAGCLLTLRQGLLAIADSAIVGTRLFDGLGDTLASLAGDLAGTPPDRVIQLQKDLDSAVDSRPTTLAATRIWLERLAGAAAALPGDLDPVREIEARRWADAFARQCRDALAELTFLAPWTSATSDTGQPIAPPGFDHIPTLRQLASTSAPHLAPGTDLAGNGVAQALPDELRSLVALASQRAADRIAAAEALALQAAGFAGMDYGFLFDASRRLLTIGYNVAERRPDSSYYDLLASEARLCTFVAIAQAQLPQESWFALGRLLTTAGGEPVLLSWSGSMFEYLMPMLLMPTYDNTLLDRTCRAAVERQIEYGRARGVPWGISESGYNTMDARLNYQYRAFGAPGLGLKRGLAEDLVIAPYASTLALMVAPEDACANLQRLAAEGAQGRYGFYEAIDYTPARVPHGKSSAIVRSFMAHHTGMSLLSLAYLLLDRPMQKRFEADPSLLATVLLLQERVPKATAFHPHTSEIAEVRRSSGDAGSSVRELDNPDSAAPEVQLLSNGRYHVMVTHAGGGYSRWKDIALTRWREDATRDNWGTFCYLRDVASGEIWSTAHQPTLKRSEDYTAIFSEARAEFRRTDFEIHTHTEIAVSPEDDVELRRITVTNRSRIPREIELTSYAEIVLAAPAADVLHPAFSNLFVQTEILRQRQAILCTRRPRSKDEPAPWMLHLMAVHGAKIEDISYETDRMRFIGRGNTVADPRALRDSAALSGTDGSVLDPIVAIRYRITLEPEQSATINIVTGIGETRDAALHLVEKYQDRHLPDRVFELAWTHGQVILRQINATEADARLYSRLASSVIYANAALRADAAVLLQNRRGQSGLWGYSISGDLPIVLLQIGDPVSIDLVRQLARAHAYWRLKGLSADLVIWNEDHTGYRQQLNDQIMGLIAAGIESHVIDRPGGIYVRSADQIANEDRVLLQTVARAILTDSRGALGEQVDRLADAEVAVARLKAVQERQTEPEASAAPVRADLIFSNGLGGFTPDGREYVITTTARQVTPAPWVNVLANPQFGTVVSESGGAYTWSENAHEFRLTPWNNDPVSDAGGEAFYLRDEDSGYFWSPMPLPCRGATPYVTRHGFGYSVFEHTEAGIRSEVWVYVAPEASIKFTVVKLRNESSRPRRLSLTGYVEWVLGDLRTKSVMHVVTEIDAGSGALLARNPYNTEFPDRVAFFDTSAATRSVSGDRGEFLGRNGTLRNPAALARTRLSGRIGSAMDPCAAILAPFELAAGQEHEVVFTLGVGRDAADAGELIRRARGPAAARGALEQVWQHWNHILGAVQVETPDPMLDVVTNGWLIYQILTCRLWARSGYYQSGGAYGFRDQLQDTMALVHVEPHLLRAQLLLCASRQFLEGDVQHWWHPPAGRGVRTHCSDDFLWLPLATCRYVRTTADSGVLDEAVHYLEGRLVPPDADSYYDLPGHSQQSGSLYEHCVRAIERGLSFGERGLPLMGGGDWNDGMNMVGQHGQGESIWLGFFLYHVLEQFADLAGMRGDGAFAERCRGEAARLRRNLEQNGWDGAWYRRAYFDDGTPLGSASNAECQIDSIAQSWSVLSGAGDPARSRMAMDAVDQRLVQREQALVQLLDPPFDKSELDPGYIKGYVPGVRENGGQYTHAAVWTAMAFAAMGDNRRAWELARMINPVSHADSPDGVAIYKVEPYVIAADVYAATPHTGRGGWTWYTGSAGWMYRLLVESLLGLALEGTQLHIVPRLPEHWDGFKVHYRYRETVYHIAISRSRGPGTQASVSVDGVVHPGRVLPLVDDQIEHSVEVSLGALE